MSQSLLSTYSRISMSITFNNLHNSDHNVTGQRSRKKRKENQKSYLPRILSCIHQVPTTMHAIYILVSYHISRSRRTVLTTHLGIATPQQSNRSRKLNQASDIYLLLRPSRPPPKVKKKREMKKERERERERHAAVERPISAHDHIAQLPIIHATRCSTATTEREPRSRGSSPWGAVFPASGVLQRIFRQMICQLVSRWEGGGRGGL